MKANGPALKAIRLSQGWTLITLGKAVGLHPSRICHLEAEGSKHGTSPEKMRLIAEALGVPMAAITQPMFPLEDVLKSKEDAA